MISYLSLVVSAGLVIYLLMRGFRLLTVLTVLFIGIGAGAQNMVYTDASEFPLYGQISDQVNSRYERLPSYLEGVSREAVWKRGRCSSGLYIRFRSDATSVGVRWTSTFDADQNHMTDTGTRGLDLYALVDGQWRAVAPARPSAKGPYECVIIRNMAPEEREFMLYLSLYDGVQSLEIGVNEGAIIGQPEVPGPSVDKPVVMYGTSILQGGCASRPGMAYTNILSRRLDRVVYNLGFSGNARLDLEIAKLMVSVEDPGAFVLDCVPNSTEQMIQERGEKFFRILRDTHPDVPVIFVEDPVFPRAAFDTLLSEEVAGRNRKWSELFRKLKKSGEKNIYYVSSKNMLGDDGEATVDGGHFTDAGNLRYVDNIMPVLKKALKNR